MVRADTELPHNSFMATHEQFILAVVVKVEGGAPYIGTICNILNRDCVIAAFAISSINDFCSNSRVRCTRRLIFGIFISAVFTVIRFRFMNKLLLMFINEQIARRGH